MGRQFSVGDKVRVRAAQPAGHVRTPFYLRGQVGRIERYHGEFLNPEQLAYNDAGGPLCSLYMVRFAQRALWARYSGAPGDSLVADIYEHWLEPA